MMKLRNLVYIAMLLENGLLLTFGVWGVNTGSMRVMYAMFVQCCFKKLI